MPDSVAIPQPHSEAPSDRSQRVTDGRKPAELLDAVKDLTQRHFPEGPVEVEVDFDPEVPADEYFVLSVTASGTAEQIAHRQRLWRREIHQLVANQLDTFRLSVRLIV